MKTRLSGFFAALCLSAATAFAAQPFVATATTTDNLPPLTLSLQGSSFFDFLDQVIKSEGAFQPFNGRPFTGNMTFLGFADAIRYTTNANSTNVTITLTPIGFNRTFTGPTEDAVDQQLEDFFKSEGAATIADFLKAIAKTSPIAVTDGNPTAATALAAAGSFTGQGFTSIEEFSDGSEAAGSRPKFGGISLGLNAGTFEAGIFDGKIYDVSGTLLNFGGEKVRFVVPVNANFLELDSGSKVGGAGISFALPIRFRQMGRDSDLNWRVTPLGGISVRGSLDLASVSPLWTAGVVNTIDYRVNPKLVVSVVNQFTTHKSIALEYDDLNFDPDINQQILKNGLRLTSKLSQRVILDGFVVDTRFIKDAAVKQFWTLGTSLALRATQKWNLVLGLNYDTGDRFKAYSLGLTSAWKW
jgi:hypothetical protein